MNIPLTYRLLWMAVLIIGIAAGIAFGIGFFSPAGNLMMVLGTLVLGLTLTVAGGKKSR